MTWQVIGELGPPKVFGVPIMQCRFQRLRVIQTAKRDVNEARQKACRERKLSAAGFTKTPRGLDRGRVGSGLSRAEMNLILLVHGPCNGRRGMSVATHRAMTDCSQQGITKCGVPDCTALATTFNVLLWLSMFLFLWGNKPSVTTG